MQTILTSLTGPNIFAVILALAVWKDIQKKKITIEEE